MNNDDNCDGYVIDGCVSSRGGDISAVLTNVDNNNGNSGGSKGYYMVVETSATTTTIKMRTSIIMNGVYTATEIRRLARSVIKVSRGRKSLCW